MSNPVAVGLATTFLAGLVLSQATAQTASGTNKPTATPVKHLVVIFDENISFDHYFGTYPNALNPPHETRVQGSSGNAPGKWPHVHAAPAQPKFPERKSKWRLRGEPHPPGTETGIHRGPEPRLHR